MSTVEWGVSLVDFRWVVWAPRMCRRDVYIINMLTDAVTGWCMSVVCVVLIKHIFIKSNMKHFLEAWHQVVRIITSTLFVLVILSLLFNWLMLISLVFCEIVFTTIQSWSLLWHHVMLFLHDFQSTFNVIILNMWLDGVLLFFYIPDVKFNPGLVFHSFGEHWLNTE